MNRPQPHSATGNYPEREQVGEWANQALCVGLPAEWWFPAGKRGKRSSEEAQARQICARCPVQPECLGHALRNREQYGIWGGHDPEERKKIRRRRREGRPDLPRAVDVKPWRDREPLSLSQLACRAAFEDASPLS